MAYKLHKKSNYEQKTLELSPKTRKNDQVRCFSHSKTVQILNCAQAQDQIWQTTSEMKKSIFFMLLLNL